MNICRAAIDQIGPLNLDVAVSTPTDDDDDITQSHITVIDILTAESLSAIDQLAIEFNGDRLRGQSRSRFVGRVQDIVEKAQEEARALLRTAHQNLNSILYERRGHDPATDHDDETISTCQRRLDTLSTDINHILQQAKKQIRTLCNENAFAVLVVLPSWPTIIRMSPTSLALVMVHLTIAQFSDFSDMTYIPAIANALIIFAEIRPITSTNKLWSDLNKFIKALNELLGNVLPPLLSIPISMNLTSKITEAIITDWLTLDGFTADIMPEDVSRRGMKVVEKFQEMTLKMASDTAKELQNKQAWYMKWYEKISIDAVLGIIPISF